MLGRPCGRVRPGIGGLEAKEEARPLSPPGYYNLKHRRGAALAFPGSVLLVPAGDIVHWQVTSELYFNLKFKFKFRFQQA